MLGDRLPSKCCSTFADLCNPVSQAPLTRELFKLAIMECPEIGRLSKPHMVILNIPTHVMPECGGERNEIKYCVWVPLAAIC